MDRMNWTLRMTRRGMLSDAAALTASGWIGGAASGWLLRPRWAHAAGPIKMGIATDITGALAAGGNANWQVAQFTVEQINQSGGIFGRPIELHLEDTASDPHSRRSSRRASTPSPTSATFSICCATTIWRARCARSCAAIGGRRRCGSWRSARIGASPPSSGLGAARQPPPFLPLMISIGPFDISLSSTLIYGGL